ncbi:MAG: hypothetical protein JWO35_503 [Candidatus Saccharibacteria bacterium]|nr:hypothetical protein [Candidatus Saccharibacteria bacterium]
MFREVIDDAIEETRLPDDLLAQQVTKALYSNADNQMRNPVSSGNGAETFRLSTLVEVPGSKIGYGLALSPYGKTEDDPVISARFYIIDRDCLELIEEPKVITLMEPYSKPDHAEIAEATVGHLDRTELLAVRSMLGKAARVLKDGKSRNDGDVLKTLMNAEIEQLAALFPRPIEQEQTHEDIHPCESHEFQEAALAVMQEEKDQINLRYLMDNELHLLSIGYADGDIDHITFAINGVSPRLATFTPGFIPRPGQELTVEGFPESETLVKIIKRGVETSDKLFNSYIKEVIDAQRELLDTALVPLRFN